MDRRSVLEYSAVLSALAFFRQISVGSDRNGAATVKDKPTSAGRLVPPATGSIPVAFPISKKAVVIDFCGPWSVFECVDDPSRKDDAFRLYTVADSLAPVEASNGLIIHPNYTFEDAPVPKLIVIPAQDGSDSMIAWIKKHAPKTDVTMSVCGGAFLLAKTGLLAGGSATTHHNAFNNFAKQFPDIRLQKNVRWVEEDRLATSGGMTAGIDLALHIVERYFGRNIAERTAAYMEYQGLGWKDESGSAAS